MRHPRKGSPKKQSTPSQGAIFATLANIGQAVVLAQTAERLLNTMMSMFPERNSMKKLTVAQIEKQSGRRRKRTFGQLVNFINEVLKSDRTHLFEDFLENRNTLIHRMMGTSYGVRFDTEEGLSKANELALKVKTSSSIDVLIFAKGVKVLAERLREMSGRHGEDLDISGLLEDVNYILKVSLHPIVGPKLEATFTRLNLNWKNPLSEPD
jgi:hypothetical protein